MFRIADCVFFSFKAGNGFPQEATWLFDLSHFHLMELVGFNDLQYYDSFKFDSVTVILQHYSC